MYEYSSGNSCPFLRNGKNRKKRKNKNRRPLVRASSPHGLPFLFYVSRQLFHLIPMPGFPAGIGGCGSLIWETADSVVSSVAATELAFSKADLVTFTGSRIPVSTISTYSPVRALYPIPTFASRTLFTITAPSSPAFSAIRYSGAESALWMI